MSDVPMLVWMNRLIPIDCCSLFGSRGWASLPLVRLHLVSYLPDPHCGRERGVCTLIKAMWYIMTWMPAHSCVQVQRTGDWRGGWGSGLAAVKFSHTHWETARVAMLHCASVHGAAVVAASDCFGNHHMLYLHFTSYLSFCYLGPSSLSK